jgi:hypothetical protein
MGQCIIMLKHEVMTVNEWHNNGPQDLIMVSLCVQVPIDKMQLCFTSACLPASPYHNPTPTMGCSVSTTLTLANHSHTLPSARYSLAHFSSIPVAIEGEHLPTEVGYDAVLQSGKDSGEDDEQVSFPQDPGQYFVDTPLVAITASILLGYDTTSLAHLYLGTFSHSSLFSADPL